MKILAAALAFVLGMLVMYMGSVPEQKEYRIVLQRQELGSPIKCDATVEQRTKPNKPWSHACYIAGMRK